MDYNISEKARLWVRASGFIVKERFRFQFRAEAYNTFNHTQFSGVDTTIQYNAVGQNIRSTSGQITSSRDPRIMQFAMRVMF